MRIDSNVFEEESEKQKCFERYIYVEEKKSNIIIDRNIEFEYKIKFSKKGERK